MRAARAWLPALHLAGWVGVLLWVVAVLLTAVLAVGRVERHSVAQPPAGDEAMAYQRQAAAIAALLARVPPLSERERLLAEALVAGDGAGLRINGGRYEEVRTQGELQRIETTLPVTADAVAILRWLDALDERAPTAVVTRVTLVRGAPGEPLVGDIKLDFYLRSAR